jgi:pentatricopeptide repeat protein
VTNFEELGMPKSELVFRSIVDAYLDCGDLDLALRMYEKMKHKFTPEVPIFVRLITEAGNHKRYV